MEIPPVEVQHLYRQWQDGKLLDNDERSALHASWPAEGGQPRFADFLKSAAELDD